ncbi:hypothetical protein HBB16_21680 [Pseudonocardia sp. MCCB 268]|nr:hypothetical protein [Pseudonocardia cytotoxica]
MGIALIPQAAIALHPTTCSLTCGFPRTARGLWGVVRLRRHRPSGERLPDDPGRRRRRRHVPDRGRPGGVPEPAIRYGRDSGSGNRSSLCDDVVLVDEPELPAAPHRTPRWCAAGCRSWRARGPCPRTGSARKVSPVDAEQREGRTSISPV